MKVRMMIELELPEKYADYLPSELGQLLFDDYTNYVVVSHLKDAMERAVGLGGPDEKPLDREAYQHHYDTAKWCRATAWEWERI